MQFPAETFHAPLSELWLCPDCGCAGTNSEVCPGCANPHGLLNLGSVLDRIEQATERAENYLL